MRDAARPITRVETVSLESAHRRVLASAMVAAQDVPPFTRAAMDGYAVVAEDSFGAGQFPPRVLRLVEKVYTGQAPTRPVAGGGITEIATGAPMPDGAERG
jgi:molybdopterin molybdotransferase